ncbi:glycosyltransferase family 2 protein [Brasilonema octagenarum]|uniref:Glycosyl transferase family 2 n=1 Tax=Brasilonema octagenarum UFV-OR1 TaxID=417115 RepID=A0ABX1M3S5_9CYAN|nr:glycosyltransferase [Brasilonema octagenarum]NMF62221.1 glycosyl transferase family 2 [Brasilonema octagenarum UFV-OR1]
MKDLQTNKLQPIALPLLPENPLVSVLISNYNYARYIGETLESVLCQTYPHFEAIVCDDGSSDNSCEVIETYVQKDPRIKLIRKQNGGIASGLNAAYQQSKGEIVCILDADDLWMPTKLQRVVEKLKSQSKCGFVIHNVIQIDGQGKNIKPTPMMKQLASGWMAPDVLENGGFIENLPPASALSIRREIASLIFPINEAMKRHVDGLIIFLALLVTEVRAVPEVLNKFRLHGANTTSLAPITVDSMERSLSALEHIHQEQKQLLKKVYGTEIAEQLRDLRYSLAICQYRYLLARLKGISRKQRREVHQHLISHPQFSTEFSWFKPQRWLFQWNLPDALFTLLFNQVYGVSPLKQFVKSLFARKPAMHSAKLLSE